MGKEVELHMKGIVSFGGYLPLYRIDRDLVMKSMGWLNQAASIKGQKCVANWDEDSLTMAVVSGMNCLEGHERSSVGCLYFATTTSPFQEKGCADIIRTALDLDSSVRTADFSGSTGAGTAALIAALNGISEGSSEQTLVCASDMRLGKPGSSQELTFSDGAASLMVGSNAVVAEYGGSYSVSYDFPDHWRAEHDRTDRAWEDRFGREEGYRRFIPEAITGLMNRYHLRLSDVSKVIIPGIYPRDHAGICKRMGLDPSQVQDHLMTAMGNTGSPYPLMLLISALEEAGPGDVLIVAGFGNGSDALLFRVTQEIEGRRARTRGIKRYLEMKRELASYEKYLAFRNLIRPEGGIRAEAIPFTALSLVWRDRREIIGLCGTRCTRCGTPQYPAQRVCVNPECGAIDEMEPYRFSDRKGAIFSFTGDRLSFTPHPPAIYALVDFEGGGRFWFDVTDCDLEAMRIGMPVELTFRRRYVDEKSGIISYFWKAVPIL
jgi:hydroxymethylglutaryl-CoA synthase